MNKVIYEQGYLWTRLFMNKVIYVQGALWTRLFMNKVHREHGALWTRCKVNYEKVCVMHKVHHEYIKWYTYKQKLHKTHENYKIQIYIIQKYTQNNKFTLNKKHRQCVGLCTNTKTNTRFIEIK